MFSWAKNIFFFFENANSEIFSTRFRCGKGFMYQDIRRYAIDGKAEDTMRGNRKKELGRIFKRVFHLNAFQVRQGKGTSNNGEFLVCAQDFATS